MTCQWDRLPRDVSDCYLHKLSTSAGDKSARVARFFNSITAVKEIKVDVEDDAKGTYERVHVSF